MLRRPVRAVTTPTATATATATALALTLALASAWPATAAASAFTTVERAYSQSTTGTLSPCQFSSTELEAALKQAPSYDFQYQADFTDAIEAALAARANGDCATATATPSSGATAAGAASTSGGGSGTLGTGTRLAGARLAGAKLPASLSASPAGGLPLVLWLAFILVAAGLLIVSGWLALNALGLDPRSGRAARHSLREAEHRIGAGWDELTDRLRR